MKNDFIPRMVQIKVADLRIDSLYQRNEKLNKRLIKKIFKEFDPHLLGVLIVSKRGCVYYVIDGQHRLEVLKMKSIETAWCIVEEGITRQEEAEKFIAYGVNRTNLTPSSLFKAELASGNLKSIQLNTIAERHNFYVGGGKKGNGNNIYAVGKLKEIYAILGDQDFERLFVLLRAAWNGNNESLNNCNLGGLSFMIKKCGVLFSNKDFIEKMKKVAPSEIKIVGKAYRGSGKDSDKAYGMGMLHFYNLGRTTNKIPETLLME